MFLKWLLFVTANTLQVLAGKQHTLIITDKAFASVLLLVNAFPLNENPESDGHGE